MEKSESRKTAQVVVKISKYCNLRCTYCYEFKELANKQRMQLESLRSFFANVRDHALEHGFESLEFVWHGGEPFLVPLEYYEVLKAEQKKIFADGLPISNVVQSNLTVLTDRHLEFLKSGEFFRAIGVSFDVYGDQRVDTSGKLRTDAILGNLQRLMGARIPFGAITVLARNTAPHARSIYKFWDKLGIQFRFLPFYMSAFEEQVGRHALSNEEIVAVWKDIFTDWLASERATAVDPIAEYVGYAVAHLTNQPRHRYDKMSDEMVFLVNLDGGVWGVGDAYDQALCYGNAFRENFTNILSSPCRRKVVDAASMRVATYCANCPYHGHCPGAFVADATPEQVAGLERSGCPVRQTLDHITDTLKRSVITEALIHGGVPQIENSALKVLL